jgi:endonuclease/exonuclease/phosphatase family metal-dependent hydrolase
MKFKSLVVIYAFVSLLPACGNRLMQSTTAANKNTADTTFNLQVLCYNIHHANPPSKPGIIDLEAIAKVIRQQAPDLVALQEVDVFTNRSGKTSNQAAELAKLSGLPYYYFAKAIDYDGGEYGVAILSRFPFEAVKNTPLPTAAGTNGEPRTLATADVRLPHGKQIVFACTHLDAQKSDTNRLLQINKITEILQQEKLPVVIAGDFNATPSTRIIDQLDQYFKRSCLVGCGFTIPVNNPTRTIDFVAYKPIRAFAVTSHAIIDEKYASDHLPVFSVLQIK